MRCIHRLMKMVCAEGHRTILQELGVDSLALLTESMCVLGGRLRFSKEVDHVLEVSQHVCGFLECSATLADPPLGPVPLHARDCALVNQNC